MNRFLIVLAGTCEVISLLVIDFSPGLSIVLALAGSFFGIVALALSRYSQPSSRCPSASRS